jgi:hypothetical protein
VGACSGRWVGDGIVRARTNRKHNTSACSLGSSGGVLGGGDGNIAGWWWDGGGGDGGILRGGGVLGEDI